MPIKDVTDLKIYQQSMAVLPDVYQLCARIPERSLREQLQKSARSIAANITEGFSRKTSVREFKRFLVIAMASSDETVTHLRQVELLHSLPTSELVGAFRDISSRIQRTISTWS